MREINPENVGFCTKTPQRGRGTWSPVQEEIQLLSAGDQEQRTADFDSVDDRRLYTFIFIVLKAETEFCLSESMKRKQSKRPETKPKRDQNPNLNS